MRFSGKYLITLALAALAVLLQQCKKDDDSTPSIPGATPYTFVVPQGFPPVEIPANNPMTVEGIRLGRMLFYEKRLSGDNTMACADCHLQDQNFSDFNQFSTGIDGIEGTMQAMPIMNLAWQEFFFWNGRATSLEQQAIEPVENPIEMHELWPNALAKLQADPAYVSLFTKAFGPGGITRDRATKAIAQFERTLISANSRFDQWRAGTVQFTPEEELGYQIFNSEQGDCFHCHGDLATGNLFGAYGQLQFSNNGLDATIEPNSGREAVTGNPADRSKFKIPSLRNIEYSFPYMHDGSIPTLDSIIGFYNFGGHVTPTTDPNMKAAGIGRSWTPQQKAALKAFLLTLSDPEFLTDTAFASPF